MTSLGRWETYWELWVLKSIRWLVKIESLYSEVIQSPNQGDSSFFGACFQVCLTIFYHNQRSLMLGDMITWFANGGLNDLQALARHWSTDQVRNRKRKTKYQSPVTGRCKTLVRYLHSSLPQFYMRRPIKFLSRHNEQEYTNVQIKSWKYHDVLLKWKNMAQLLGVQGNIFKFEAHHWW